MLSRFYVGNYKSFDAITEFSMVAGDEKRMKDQLIQVNSNFKLLKKAVIYGANASGKSNLIKAVDLSKQIVLNGISTSMDLRNEYHRNKIENASLPTTFQYEIVIDEKVLIYGFDVLLKEHKILKEWLYENKKSGAKRIFERDLTTSTFEMDGLKSLKASIRNKVSVYIDDSLYDDKTLFITMINGKNNEVKETLPYIKQIHDWFKKIMVVYPNTVLTGVFNLFIKEKDNVSIIKLLEYFDTGIKNYSMVKSNLAEIENSLPPLDYDDLIEDIISMTSDFIESIKDHNQQMSNAESRILRLNLNTSNDIYEITIDKPFNLILEQSFSVQDMRIKKLVFNHNDSKNIHFNFSEESDGTKRLIELLDVIVNQQNDNIFFIDELDRSLHPMLTKKFIETYDRYTKCLNRQLIVTTHESSLMDQELLRRDSIWLVERNNSCSSELLSLDSFNERYDKKLEKAYFEGRYGAIPVFKDMEFLVAEDGEICP